MRGKICGGKINGKFIEAKHLIGASEREREKEEEEKSEDGKNSLLCVPAQLTHFTCQFMYRIHSRE